ncbi:MAG: hypothetical protein ACI8RD_000247 [Bacillariaceae sp.]|jgi:hypothetical protein
MREISSSASSMSRDPDGINPRDKYTSQLEPSGTFSSEVQNNYGDNIITTSSSSSSPDNNNNNNEVMDDFREEGQMQIQMMQEDAQMDKYDSMDMDMDMDNMDMKFVGLLPPPPPPTTPKKKKSSNQRRNSGRSTKSNYSNSSPTSSLKENEEADVVGIRGISGNDNDNDANAEDSSDDNENRRACGNNNDNNNNVSTPKQKQQQQPQQPLNKVVVSKSFPSSLSPSPSSSSSSSPKNRNIVEERLQLALSTYESDVLVLDEEASTRDMPASPTRSKIPIQQDNNEVMMTTEEEDNQKKGRRRGHKEKKKHNNKRGFLKKLFGGGGKNNNNCDDHGFPVVPSSSSAQPNNNNNTEDSSSPPPPTEGGNIAYSRQSSPTSTNSKMEEMSINTDTTQPADDHDDAVPTNTLSLDTEDNSVEDEMKYSINSTVSRESTTAPPKLRSLFSYDPPDDYHGDPPEYSGPPLLSPTANSRANNNSNNNNVFLEEEDSVVANKIVRSRLAEVYGGQTPTTTTGIDADRDGFGIVNELSPKSKLQEDSNSPDVQYQDQNEDDSKSVAHSKSHLRVQTNSENPCMDPVGASPTVQGNKQVTRLVSGDPVGVTPTAGKNVTTTTTRIISSNDPVGASPFHASKKTAPTIPFDGPELLLYSMHDDSNNNNNIIDPPLDHLPMDNESDVGGSFLPINNVPVKEAELSSLLSSASLTVESPVEVDDLVASSGNFDPVARSNEKQVSEEEAQPQQQSAEVSSKNTISISTTSKPTGGTRKVCLNVETATENTTKEQSISSQVVKKSTTSKEEEESRLEIEKSGFNSASNTPSAAEKPFTVSAAAFTNAKALAYLHQLQGEPSPRHSWHSSKKANNALPAPVSEKSAVLAKLKKFNSKRMKNKKNIAAKNKGPSPDEYSATNSRVGEEIVKTYGKSIDSEEDLPTPKRSHSKRGFDLEPPKKNYVNHDPSKKFAPYSRFQGRRPRKAKSSEPNPEESPTPADTSTEHKPDENHSELERYQSLVLTIIPSGNMSGLAVARGVELKHYKQVTGIPTRRALRVSLSPRPEGGNRFNFFPANESEIKDPIQRAGRRLLSKAAIPIQTGARMFLSKREAIDRMWALIQLQSYVRRWRCEANFQTHKHSAVLIQKTFRGYRGRQEMKNVHFCATLMQKIVRGYLAAVRAYDTIYYVSRAQALARGFLVRTSNARREKAASVIQAFCIKSFRPHYCATKIQSAWRSYSTRVGYEMFVVDVITVQSIVRRRAAYTTVDLIKKSIHSIVITRFQAVWRGYAGRKSLAAKKIQSMCRRQMAKDQYKKVRAVTKIQASFRGFQAYTDFIFVIVDVLVVQRMVRQWLAIRRTNKLRKERAAIVLQSAWRRKQAQANLLYSLVHIIMVQSVARRYLSKDEVQGRRLEANVSLAIQRRKVEAATTIQKSWRGFWGYSHFIIVQYEITRIQALMRGKLARDAYNLKLGCAILIQAVVRRSLAKKTVAIKIVSSTISSTVVASKTLELRERNSAKHIQFWWRIVLDWMKEKKAALVIERFFLRVKAEVDCELHRREKKRIMKGKQRKKYQLKSEDELLENVWLNTVDEDAPAGVKGGLRSQSAPRSRPSTKKLVGDHKKMIQRGGDHGFDIDEPISYMVPPPEFLHLAPSADYSMVSNITTPSVLNPPIKKGVERSRNGNNSEEIIYQEVKARSKNEKHRLSTNDYIKKYGALQTVPNRLSESQSFFSDDGSNISASRRQSSDGKKPTKLSISGLDTVQGGFDVIGVPATPRSRSGSTPRAVSRSRRGSSSSQFLPPVTPTRKRSTSILRSGTASTASMTLNNDTITMSRSSPRKHPNVHGRGGNRVMVMKTQSDFMDDQSIKEAHEILLLGDDYGEV